MKRQNVRNYQFTKILILISLINVLIEHQNIRNY